jgi:hypothetical protein
MRKSIELDFSFTDAEGAHAEEALDAWVEEFAPFVIGEVVREHGPAGGAAVIRLTAPSEDVLREAVLAYCGGDERQLEEVFEVVNT